MKRVKKVYKNKYIKKLCVTLVIYQGTLHDARSTKYKILSKIVQCVILTICLAVFVFTALSVYFLLHK